jgi:hypothetical protein
MCRKNTHRLRPYSQPTPDSQPSPVLHMRTTAAYCTAWAAAKVAIGMLLLQLPHSIRMEALCMQHLLYAIARHFTPQLLRATVLTQAFSALHAFSTLPTWGYETTAPAAMPRRRGPRYARHITQPVWLSQPMHALLCADDNAMHRIKVYLVNTSDQNGASHCVSHVFFAAAAGRCASQQTVCCAWPYLFILTSAQLRSQCDVWLASLQTVQHALHAASESGCCCRFVCSSHPLSHITHSVEQSLVLGPVCN